MALSPEFFRGMSPGQIMTALVVEDTVKRGAEARASGASCIECRDTGMAGGSFCSCPRVAPLGLQGFRP